jgi:hypothetical protein
MPRYDYFCPANGRTIEVTHPMSEKLSTWAELAARAGEEPGETPPGAAVERVLSSAVTLGGAPSPRGGGCSRPGGCGCR